MSHIDPDAVIAPAGRPLSEERRASGIVDVRSFELGWADVGVLPAMLIAYDVEAFGVAAFARHGIDMPASIERSVKKRQAEFFMGRLAAGDALEALSEVGREHPSPLKRLLQGAREGHSDGGREGRSDGGREGRSEGQAMGERWQIAVGASREPVWPAGVVGSITHAGPYAAAVVASAAGITGIGIDIEGRIGPETRQSVEDTVLKPAEQSLLHALAGSVPYEMLLTIAFSAKESFFKGSFASVGTYFDFDAVHLTALDATGGTLELVLTRSLAPALPQGRRFTLRTQCIDADTILTSFVW
jgi:4'-phosphopantetheinyl transferase EntD